MTARGSVLDHVGESVHDTAAQGAAGDLHATDTRPLAGLHIIAFSFTGGGDVPETPDHKQPVLDHFDAKATATVQHGGYSVPGVGGGVVGLSSAQTGGPTETTNLLEKR